MMRFLVVALAGGALALTLILTTSMMIIMRLGDTVGGDVLVVSAGNAHRANLSDILLVDVERGTVFPLVGEVGGVHYAPVWSPDGEHLAYLSTSGLSLEIIVTRLGQPIPPPIVSSDSLTQFSTPSWSPDGGRIAYIALDAIDSRLKIFYVFDLATAQSITYVQDPIFGDFTSPVWSPDGRYLLVLIGVDTRSFRMGLIDTQTAERQFLLPDEAVQDIAWLPDGRIIYVAQGRLRSDVFLLDLTDNSTVNISQTNFVDRYPQPSPDGSQIAYFSNRNGHWSIYIYDLTTQETRHLHNSVTVTTSGFAWSPDGKRLAYVSGGRLLEADVQTGEIQAITLAGYFFSESFSGLGYRPR